MELARRIRWIALSLPVALAAAVALARPAPPGALAAVPLRAAGCAPAIGAISLIADAWARLDPVLDAGGSLSGQRLTVGRGTARWTEALAAESFASAPSAGRVLVGDDDGRRSRLRVLDTSTGCWHPAGVEASVVRSGVLAADGTVIYEHRVERSTRRDLGVWRTSPRDPGTSVQVLAGLADDTAFGPTFATSLLVDADGRLVVSGCGLSACRIRVMDADGVRIRQVAGTGPAVRIDGDRLVVEGTCDALPCARDAVDLDTGARTPLTEARP